MRVLRSRTGGRRAGIPLVDYAHPLAQGLQAAYYFDAGLYDVARNNRAAVQGVSVGRFPNVNGGLAGGFSDAKFGSGNYDSYLSIPSGNWNTSPLLSVCAWAMSLDQSGVYKAIITASFDGTSVPIELCIGDDQIFQTTFLVAASYNAGWHIARDVNVLVPQKWYFVCGTLDGTNINLYIDGRFVASTAATAATNNTLGYYIGTRHDQVGAGSTWNGLISDVRVYNRALSAGEVWELYVNPGAGLVWPTPFLFQGPGGGPGGMLMGAMVF
jgi:Concanavalin A-like lectin/glucanases superfamily